MFYICSMCGVHIIWFRQDLRVHDHGALKAAHLAAQRDGGHLLPLFIFDDARSLTPFLDDAIRDLEHALVQRGAALHLRQGESVHVLSDLHAHHNVLSLHAHETLGDGAKDRAVEAWSLRAGVAFRAQSQFGPGLALGQSAEGQSEWCTFMSAPRHAAPEALRSMDAGLGRRPELSAPAMRSSQDGQGGRKAAINLLRSLLGQVSDLEQVGADANLRDGSAFTALRPYLELGVLSIREVWQAASSARQQFEAAGQDIRAAWVRGLMDRLPDLERERLRQGTPRMARHWGVSHPDRQGEPQLSLNLEPNERQG